MLHEIPDFLILFCGSNDHTTAIVSIVADDKSQLDDNLRTGSGPSNTERLVSGMSDRMPQSIE
jgi:hypothetical protein